MNFQRFIWKKDFISLKRDFCQEWNWTISKFSLLFINFICHQINLTKVNQSIYWSHWFMNLCCLNLSKRKELGIFNSIYTSSACSYFINSIKRKYFIVYFRNRACSDWFYLLLMSYWIVFSFLFRYWWPFKICGTPFYS